MRRTKEDVIIGNSHSSQQTLAFGSSAMAGYDKISSRLGLAVNVNVSGCGRGCERECQCTLYVQNINVCVYEIGPSKLKAY